MDGMYADETVGLLIVVLLFGLVILGGVVVLVGWFLDRQKERQKRRAARATRRFVGRLNHEDKRVREAAMKGLLQMGKLHAVPHLVPLLTDERTEVRENAAEVLGQLCWAPLTVEHRILYLVAKHEWGASTALLARAGTVVREHVAEALGRFQWDLEKLEQRQKILYLVARHAWAELIAIGEQSVWPLLNVFARNDLETQQAIVKAWVEKGMPHTGLLVTAIQDDNLRQSAAALLGLARDRRTVGPLTRLLCDESLSVRETAAYALGLIGDASAVEALQVCWRTTDVEHLSLRRAARWALHRTDPNQSPGGEPGPVWLPWFHEIWVPKSWGKPERQ